MAELIPIFAIFFIIGVPVMSLAAHFVLRPLVGDIVRALRGGTRDDLASLQAQIADLREDLVRHEEEIDQLVEAESFRRRLEASGEKVGLTK